MSNGYELYAVFVAKKRRTYQDVQGRSSQKGIGRGSSRHRHEVGKMPNLFMSYLIRTKQVKTQDGTIGKTRQETRARKEHGGTNEVLRGLAALPSPSLGDLFVDFEVDPFAFD